MDVPMMSANLDRGTATSVLHSTVPSFRILTIVNRASFLAAQRSVSSCLVLAKWKAPGWCGVISCWTRVMSLWIAEGVPENL